LDPEYRIGDLVRLNVDKKPLGLTVLVDVCGDVFEMELNRDGLIPKIVGRFFKSDVGVVVQIDGETCMTRVMTKSGVVGWAKTWDFIPVKDGGGA
jgi:hypothetical protein